MVDGITLSRISKQFGSLIALDNVTVTLRPGRVHGLLGENGAGKSTLMNVLYGLLRTDSGRISRDGAPLTIRSPLDAISAGIGMVHQHFMLVGAMTVLDNVLLGDHRAGRWLDRWAARQRLHALAGQLELPIDPEARVDTLSVGGQQRVEILKALYRDVQVLILDEPTAVLTPAETEQLMAAVKRLKTLGKSVVFISHKLGEVKRICDDLTVLRRGRVAWEGDAAGVDPRELARLMVGREVTLVSRDRAIALPSVGRDQSPHIAPILPAPGAQYGIENALKLESISADGLREVSLSVAPGEILGIAGVDGNGQQELAEVIVGLRKAGSGSVMIGQRDVTAESSRRRQEFGVAHIPNDRKQEGLVGSMSIARNIALKRHNRRPFSVGGWMNWWRVRRAARELVTRFDIRAKSIDVPVSTLSGGNAQKVILARELALAEPKLIVAMNPVRGLDIAATQFVYEQLLERRHAGCAILFISSELDELVAMCDRIGVLYGGRLTMSHFPRDGVTEIGRLMAGL